MKTGYIYKGICLTCIMGKSLKNKEWYVDGKASLYLGYDAIRLRLDLVIPRVSAYGDGALPRV